MRRSQHSLQILYHSFQAGAPPPTDNIRPLYFAAGIETFLTLEKLAPAAVAEEGGYLIQDFSAFTTNNLSCHIPA
jgi:hypothetical protein